MKNLTMEQMALVALARNAHGIALRGSFGFLSRKRSNAYGFFNSLMKGQSFPNSPAQYSMLIEVFLVLAPRLLDKLEKAVCRYARSLNAAQREKAKKLVELFDEPLFDAVRTDGRQGKTLSTLDNPETASIREERKAAISKALATLSPKHEFIIRAVIGLDMDALSLEAIANELGLTVPSVIDVLGNALLKLQTYNRKRLLEPYRYS